MMTEKKEATAGKPPVKNEFKEEKEKQGLNSEELKKQLEECQKQKDEYLTGWQRARADFLNYKKEEMERLGQVIDCSKVEMILKMLPLLDSFEIAEKQLSEDLKNNDSIKGILQIKNQILDFLKSQGVEEIKSIGQSFDPNFHEVIEEVEPFLAKIMEGKEIKSGIIIEEVQKGYKINGRLLRPAKVKTAK